MRNNNVSNISRNLIPGKYIHYKGNSYIVYCLAKDSIGQEFVLYQQCYGDKGFWIRPYKMFFEKVKLEDGSIVERFRPTNNKRQANSSKIQNLLEMIKSGTLTIKHSETCEEYCITNIKESRNYVIIDRKNNNGSGYLTEYQLLDRMGYTGCIINEEVNFIDKKEPLPDELQLKIGENKKALIESLINPCSIDLKIANLGYLKTKRKTIDPPIDRICVRGK